MLFATPRKNTIYERYVFFSKSQENSESIDHYVTVLKAMSNMCEFADLKRVVDSRLGYVWNSG